MNLLKWINIFNFPSVLISLRSILNWFSFCDYLRHMSLANTLAIIPLNLLLKFMSRSNGGTSQGKENLQLGMSTLSSLGGRTRGTSLQEFDTNYKRGLMNRNLHLNVHLKSDREQWTIWLLRNFVRMPSTNHKHTNGVVISRCWRRNAWPRELCSPSPNKALTNRSSVGSSWGVEPTP